MTPRTSFDADALIGPLYFVAFLLVATPLVDFFTGILPLAFGNVQWRFGSVGLLSGFLLTPLLGMLLAIGVAHYAEHRGVQRALAVTNLVVSGLLLVVFMGFVLDVIQLRAAVDDEARSQFQSAWVKAVLKYAAFIVVTSWLGIAGLRLTRRPALAMRSRAGSIVVGA